VCRPCFLGKDERGGEAACLNVAIDGRGDWDTDHGWWRRVLGDR